MLRGLAAAGVLGLALVPRVAAAQPEFRCPPGWGRADNVVSLRTTPHPAAREALARCSGGPGSTIVLEVDQLDPPALAEAEWTRRRFPGAVAGPFRDEAVPGVARPIRTLEWAEVRPAQGHHGEMTNYGRAARIALGGGLVTVVSSDVTGGDFSWSAPERAAVAAEHRRVFAAFLASMQGLDGSTAAWHARFECPPGTAPVRDALQIVRGWRQVVRCRSADGLVDVEVRESRIPIADVAAARAEAAIASQIQPWARAEPVDRLLRSVRATSLGGHTAYLGALSWPVLRDMGRDDRPVRALLTIAVVPTPLGNVQVGWLARGAAIPRARRGVRELLAAGAP